LLEGLIGLVGKELSLTQKTINAKQTIEGMKSQVFLF